MITSLRGPRLGKTAEATLEADPAPGIGQYRKGEFFGRAEELTYLTTLGNAQMTTFRVCYVVVRLCSSFDFAEFFFTLLGLCMEYSSDVYLPTYIILDSLKGMYAF